MSSKHKALKKGLQEVAPDDIGESDAPQAMKATKKKRTASPLKQPKTIDISSHPNDGSDDEEQMDEQIDELSDNNVEDADVADKHENKKKHANNDAKKEEKKRKKLIEKRKKAKMLGYRNLAIAAGYVDTGDKYVNFTTKECLTSLISVHSAKRMMLFHPANPGDTSFEKDEFARRLELIKHGVPAKAARVTQACCDAIMRGVMNEAVLRAVENNKKSVTPSMMASVLRQYAANMEFTAVKPPLGLIRYGQSQGMRTSGTSEELKQMNDEREQNEKNLELYKKVTAKDPPVDNNGESAGAADMEVESN